LNIVLALGVPIVAVVAVVVTLNVTSESSTAASGNTIAIKNFSFSPAPLVAKAGSAIKVTNDDSTPHTLTADDKSFDTGVLNGGSGGTIKLGGPGTYTYHCEIHNYMTGKINVT
jgi:plastocyanin